MKAGLMFSMLRRIRLHILSPDYKVIAIEERDLTLSRE